MKEDWVMFDDAFWRFLGWAALVLGTLAVIGVGTLVYGVYTLLT